MASENEVEKFLKEFKTKLRIFDVIFVGRGKNDQALLDLEIVPADRKKVLKDLNIGDYSEGPLEETMHGGSNMWVFGKQVSGKEVYIKIAMGRSDSSVICISFHIAEQSINYPFNQ